jgi:hypothetical protein
MSSVKVTVREGWTVYDGETQRGPGATFTVERETAEVWLANGWVEPAVKPSK